MKLIGIYIGKNKHFYSVIDKDSGEVLTNPTSFNNNREGFDSLINNIISYPKETILIGMQWYELKKVNLEVCAIFLCFKITAQII